MNQGVIWITTAKAIERRAFHIERHHRRVKDVSAGIRDPHERRIILVPDRIRHGHSRRKRRTVRPGLASAFGQEINRPGIENQFAIGRNLGLTDRASDPRIGKLARPVDPEARGGIAVTGIQQHIPNVFAASHAPHVERQGDRTRLEINRAGRDRLTARSCACAVVPPSVSPTATPATSAAPGSE
jgi:hypothetical protein